MNMKNLEEVRESLHRRILNLRNLETILNNHSIDRLWEESSNDKKQELLKCIIDEDRNCLDQWIKTHPCLDIEEMSTRRLKVLAKKLGVANYSRLDRRELILNIISKEIDNASA